MAKANTKPFNRMAHFVAALDNEQLNNLRKAVATEEIMRDDAWARMMEKVKPKAMAKRAGV